MSEYRCGQCKREYSRIEYDQLDRQPMNPEEDDPMNGSGYERVCECGAGFHSDKWTLRDTVETEHGEVSVSTVNLTIPHGPNRTQWYETCIFHDGGSKVVDRYTCQSDAEAGHREYVRAAEKGRFELQPTGTTVVFEE